MARKKVLVINLGWEQDPLLEALARRDVELFGVHYNEQYSRRSPLSDTLICDLRDLPRIIEFADRIGVDAVVSDQCDYSSFAQAVIAERRGLPGPRVLQAQVATNKLLQREHAQKAGLLIPEYALCLGIEDARAFAGRHGYPVIAKPVDNRGSFGVNKINGPEDIEFAFYDALMNSHSRLVLLEGFIEGVHITIDGYAFREAGCRSLTLATKTLVGTKRQVAMDILYPGELPDDIVRHAMAVNENVNRQLGFSFGMTHSEYMVTARGEVYLIESANRGGGVFTSEVIVGAVSGIDVLEEYVDDVLAIEHVERYASPKRNKVLLKFFSLPPGKVSKVELPAAMTGDPCVLRHRIAIKPGDVIAEITTDANRHGFLILAGEGDVRAKAEALIEKISVTYEDT